MSQHSPAQSRDAWGRIFERFLPTVFISVALLSMLWRFTFPGRIYLACLADDFYYYFLVARNLVMRGESSFNGLQLTNGYHPLWLLINALLIKVCGDNEVFFVVQIIVIWLLVVSAFRSMQRAQMFTGIHGIAGIGCAIFSATYMTVLCRTGMEISICLCFLAAFWARMTRLPLEEQGSRDAFLSGVLISCAVLSRIDCIIVLMPYVLGSIVYASSSRRLRLRPLALFVCGLVPLGAYFAFNWFEFHTVLPVSAMAKSLKQSMTPSGAPFGRLLQFDTINLVFTWPSSLIAILYILRWLTGRGRTGARLAPQNRIGICIAIHPLLLFAALSFTSDWRVWTWYLYPFVLIVALLAPAIFSSVRCSWSYRQKATAASLGMIVCLAVLIASVRVNADGRAIYDAANALSEFSAEHAGVYAIGDRAGLAAYLMGQPVVQLEGLVEDKDFLMRIASQERLVQVLHQMKVDYYVSTRQTPDGPCVRVREPAQAGTSSPVMTARICQYPLESFVFNGVRTNIYDARALTD
jgi:hypothetical protein